MHVTLVDFNFFEYTLCLANALTAHAQVSLLTPTDFESMAGALSTEVNLCYFEKPRLRSPANLKMLSQMWQTIDRLHPDMIHLLAVNPWFNAGLMIWRPTCLVTTIHDPVMHAGDRSQRNIPQFVRDLPIQYSRRLITHGEAPRKVLVERHKLSPERVVPIPHGEFSIYRRWNDGVWPEEEGTVLFFGRIWPYKGLDYLIAAEPAISAACPNARFVIAGRGEDLERYQAQMVHPERFLMLNEYIPHADVPRLFQQASLVALPYTEASQSGVIPLAYAFGKPVVASAVGGIPEVVDHGQTGLLVPPCDSTALAQAIISLLQNRQTRSRMGEYALKKCRFELSWATIAQQTMQVYQAALGK